MAVSATSVSLSAPYVIFPLSQPLHQTRSKDREGGTYRACFTSSVESTKKRKRSAQEIAVAVDGEGVNIYDVRETQVISTYALPPTTKFSCAPTSSFTRVGKKAATFGRRTYAAVSSPKRELFCWEEQGVTNDDDKAEDINVLSRGSESRSDVVYLQDMRKRGMAGGLIAVYADGYVRCFSSDLKEQKWEFLPQTLGAAKKATVVFAASTTLNVAKKALLKDRLHIVLPTAIVTEEEETPEDAILFTVTRNGPIFEARVFTIPTTGDNKTPRELLVLPLPGTANESLATFSIHFPTATLSLLSTESLTTFSLSATVPTILSSLRISSNSQGDPTPSSLLRISSSTVLVATNEDISLYDTKFNSLQAHVPIQSSTGVNTPATSRASTPASTVKGGVSLSSYLPDLDLAVGYSQNGIAAVQLSRAGVKGEARKPGLLIDSLCRGVGADVPADINKEGQTAAAKQIASKLSAEKAKMETALTKLKAERKELDLEAFEASFAEYVNIQRNTQDVDTTMTNGTPANNAPPEFFTQSTFKPLLHEFVRTVISLIFERPGNEDGSLKITFYPPNVVKYLAESGNLSSAPSGLVNALATYDPTLRSLEWALSTVSELKITEVATAVSTALRAPEVEDLALKVIRSEVLRLALVRLDTFPTSSVIATFKSQLTGDDLAALITLLRVELSLYDYEHDDDYEAPEVAVSIGDIGIASSLLTAALDTVGISGLILQDGAESLVSSLHDEVTDAIDAVEEAAGLKGILEEMFRHAEWSSSTSLKRRVEVRGAAPSASATAPATPVLETPKRAGGKDPETPSMQLLKSAMKARGDLSVRKGTPPGLLRPAPETPRPSEKVGGTALLPLGLSPAPLGRENRVEGLPMEAEKRETGRKKARENGLRKSLGLGVYSVESMVI